MLMFQALQTLGTISLITYLIVRVGELKTEIDLISCSLVPHHPPFEESDDDSDSETIRLEYGCCINCKMCEICDPDLLDARP